MTVSPMQELSDDELDRMIGELQDKMMDKTGLDTDGLDALDEQVGVPKTH